MRKIALLLLIILAFGAWASARWFVHRGEIKATIVFRDAAALHRGDSVVEDGLPVGRIIRIDRLDDRNAVTVRLDRDHRRAILTDSLFRIDGPKLVVENMLAVGAPVEDGAIVEAREDQLSEWLVRHGGAVKPLVARIRQGTDALFDDKLDEWKKKAPEWKREGSEAFERHLQDVRAEAARLDAELRRAGKSEQAENLKERVQRWIDSVK